MSLPNTASLRGKLKVLCKHLHAIALYELEHFRALIFTKAN